MGNFSLLYLVLVENFVKSEVITVVGVQMIHQKLYQGKNLAAGFGR